MVKNNTVFVVDAGNTTVKIGVFKNGELIENHRFANDTMVQISELQERFHSPPSILSSVLNSAETNTLMQQFKKCLLVDSSMTFPIKLNYNTPETLGIDRICNAIACATAKPNRAVVSIDIGTCIKFDFVDNTNTYQGGSISPGIALRFKSLNDYTANLPLLKEISKINSVGKSTAESILSGVMNGIQAEINGMMQNYQDKFNDLTFFMTGGDLQYFDFPLKNNIFVDYNLTLKGLYQIYLRNAH
jgi:type III pantothenate kinase